MFSLAVVGITPIAILRKLLASMIKIVEGNSYRKFYPLTLNHCSFEVRVGAYTLLEKILLEMGIEDTNSVISRNYVFLKNLCKSVESVSFVFHFL